MKKKHRNKTTNGPTALWAYQQFLAKPEWLQAIPIEEIPHIREVLGDLFEAYKERHYKATSEYHQFPQEGRPANMRAKEALNRMCHAADLSMAAYYLIRAMQKYEKNPPLDLSLYARDN